MGSTQKIVYNLKKQDNRLKGELGEIIGKHKIRYCHRTREMGREFLKKDFPFKISGKVLKFLWNYWYTIDLFRFLVADNKVENIELYEIKLKSWISNPEKVKYPVPNITPKSLKAYEEAVSEGFIVKYVEICLLDNWEYSISFKDFKKQKFIVHDGGTPYSTNAQKEQQFNPSGFKSLAEK